MNMAEQKIADLRTALSDAMDQCDAAETKQLQLMRTLRQAEQSFVDDRISNLSAIPGIGKGQELILEAIGNLKAGLVNVNGKLADIDKTLEQFDLNQVELVRQLAQPTPSLPYQAILPPWILSGYAV
jgi:hypothetical protein